ncbi:GNAT family N-acetyltransferase [Streptomyces sp. bgisy100]|uniref:GNAT family N-acetyltransferase n=1 Tax=Streptomyces sp. bgisy100 TaxID=3413783 RepID=UPI003D704F0F
MRTDVTLRLLDHALLEELLRTAVADADPGEVMPPLPGPPGWTAERRQAFERFHRSRSLAADPVETTFAVLVDRTVVGAARLRPVADTPATVEAGLWIGRSHRGQGVGGAVLDLLVHRARADGSSALIVHTTPDNTAVHRLVTRIGIEPRRQGDAVTAHVDLTVTGRDRSRADADGAAPPPLRESWPP